MFDEHGHRRKLVIFTEHRDTLNYLTERIRTLLGKAEAVVTISGGMLREDRRKAQESFTQGKQTEVLIATDAAGEGINLQRAHLMVKYDLPWNPNGWNRGSAGFTASDKPKSVISGIWWLRKHAKAMYSTGCSKNWKSNARRSAAPSSTSWANRSKDSGCDNS